MTPATILAPTYLNMLRALGAWLEKAEAQTSVAETEALLSARLAPDMFPLATQIRFACVQALEGMYRLRDEDFPPEVQELLDEGRAAVDTPGSLAGARQAIGRTVDTVATLAEEVPGDDPGRPIAHAIPNGMVFDLTAGSYARDWAIGQFYFHVMIAYAIMRANGIDLGKADYVAHMFRYIRPGTMPSD